MKTSKIKFPQTHGAILTGDVVHSSRLKVETRRNLPELLRHVSDELRQAWPQEVPLDISIFRGDAWQILVKDPALALRAALFFRAGIIAGSTDTPLDTRIAVAVGAIDFVPKGGVTEGDGPAYRESGKALDGLREPFRLSLTGEGTSQGVLASAVAAPLLDALIRNWTSRQAQAVQLRLRGLSQIEISARFRPKRISQQSVARHLERAQWPAIEAALVTLENEWLAPPRS